MLRVNPDSAPIEVSAMFQEILTYYRLNQAQFAKRCGWKTSEALTHILSERSKPSYNTMAIIIKTFPDLNGDRLLRGKGPLLLSELCESESDKNNQKNTSTSNINHINSFSEKEENYKSVIQGKDILIAKQEEEIQFLRKLVSK